MERLAYEDLEKHSYFESYIDYWLLSLSMEETAEKYGVDKPTVSRRIERIKRDLQNKWPGLLQHGHEPPMDD